MNECLCTQKNLNSSDSFILGSVRSVQLSGINGNKMNKLPNAFTVQLKTLTWFGTIELPLQESQVRLVQFALFPAMLQR